MTDKTPQAKLAFRLEILCLNDLDFFGWLTMQVAISFVFKIEMNTMYFLFEYPYMNTQATLSQADVISAQLHIIEM